MGDPQKPTETPAPAPKLSRAKKIAAVVIGIFLAGLVQQGYLSTDLLSKIVELLASIGLAQ